MNMYIVMYMNIYIPRYLEDKLRQEKSMSGLITKLLIQHYSITKPGIVMPTVEKAEQEAKVDRFRKLKGELDQHFEATNDWGA